MHKLVITETHPVQYHVPVYRHAAQVLGVPLKVVYGSDFSVAGYEDQEFGAAFAWDCDLLSGVDSHFLTTRAQGGAADYEAVKPAGLADTLQALAPAAVMALGYAHPFDRAAMRWARQQHKPLLFRGETSDPARQRSLFKRWLRDLWLRRLYRQCTALLYVGSQAKAHYQRLGVPEEKLFFSPYCVDTGNFQTSAEDRQSLRAATRTALGITDDAVVVLFSGKLSERKGVDLIPDAVATLPPSLVAKVHLLFLGDGALRASLEAQCAAQLPGRVTFAGFQNQSKLSAFYHAADLLLLPSRAMETWGLVVNEALLHGLPCIVSNTVGCQPDLVLPGETGEVCAAGDKASLSHALERLLQRCATPQLAETCRQHVTGYSIARAAEGIASAWSMLTHS